MCANVDQMCDRMCTKGLTTDNTDILLSQDSAPEKTTTEIDTISGYHLGVLHGPHPPIPVMYTWALPVRVSLVQISLLSLLKLVSG